MGELEVQDYSSSYYEKRYSGYGKRYHQETIQWLTENLSGMVLDAGCGNGFVSECRPDLNIVGIDLSKGMLKHYRGLVCHVMDVCNMSIRWNKEFNGIICRSLLHHLPLHDKALSEMYRVLRLGGNISFWETNKSAIATRIRSKTQHGDRFSNYHHSFKASELISSISKWFEIDEVRYMGFLQYPLYGFPDIIDFSRYIPFNSAIYIATREIDRIISNIPILNRTSWSIGIKAHKPE